jgi:hypothetical protein
MTRDDFDRILTEEGIDDARLRDDIWHSKPAVGLDEGKLRTAAKKFKEQLPNLRVRQALNRSMDREYGRE